MAGRQTMVFSQQQHHHSDTDYEAQVERKETATVNSSSKYIKPNHNIIKEYERSNQIK